MTYPVHRLVGWLYDVLDRLDWRVSALEVIETERHYPGLYDDLSIEAWQRKLAREQIEGEKPHDD